MCSHRDSADLAWSSGSHVWQWNWFGAGLVIEHVFDCTWTMAGTTCSGHARPGEVTHGPSSWQVLAEPRTGVLTTQLWPASRRRSVPATSTPSWRGGRRTATSSPPARHPMVSVMRTRSQCGRCGRSSSATPWTQSPPTRRPTCPVTGPWSRGDSARPTTTVQRVTFAEWTSCGSIAGSFQRSSPTTRAQ